LVFYRFIYCLLALASSASYVSYAAYGCGAGQALLLAWYPAGRQRAVVGIQPTEGSSCSAEEASTLYTRYDV